jgi:protein-disulfide isomerase
MGLVLNGVKTLRSIVLAASLAALGCHAQLVAPVPVQVGVKLPPELARRVEIMIRSKTQISEDYAFTAGIPIQSEVPGFVQIGVSFTADGTPPKTATFLVSLDGKTLGQFNKLDLSANPKDLISPVGRPSRGGPESAPVLIVGFDDLECPFCAQMHAELFPAILNRYKDQVRVVYRDLPLEELHPWALHAAVDANCLAAGSTTGYWNFVDYVHAHASEMIGADKSIPKADDKLDKLALDEGARQKVDQPQLTACILKQDNVKVKASEKDAEEGSLQLGSTPILFINGEQVTGIVPIEVIYRIIDNALVAAGQTPPPPPPPAAVQPAPATTQPAPAAKPGS